MAIKPEEVEDVRKSGKLTEEELIFISNLEKKIDDALIKNYQGEGDLLSYPCKELRKLRQPVIDEIATRYRNSGWKVDIVRGPRWLFGNYICIYTPIPERDMLEIGCVDRMVTPF